MWKYYLFNVFLFFSFSLTSQSLINSQGFESQTGSWNYNTSIPACTNGNDIWNIVNRIEDIEPSQGNYFWGIRDLRGDCSNTGLENLTFNETDISAYRNVVLTFDYQVYGFDSGDDLKYELFFDGISQGEVIFFEGDQNKSTNNWETLHINIPNHINRLKWILSVKQNGNDDYAGIDHIELTGKEIMPCGELMISEYVEGSSNNKYLELYNPTESEIELSEYNLTRFVGKDTIPSGNLILSGNIPPYGTYLIENQNESLNVQADLSTGSIMSFNGDDKIALRKGEEIIDLIGIIGDSLYFAKDVTLRRKSHIQSPNNEYNPVEWDVYETDDISDLGKHISSCSGPIPEIEVTGNQISIGDGSFASDVQKDTWFGMIPFPSDSVVTKNFTIKNTGSKALTISEISLEGEDTGEFKLQENTGFVLAVNDSLLFSVAFNPSSTGLKTAEINIYSDDASENPFNFIIQAEATGYTGNPVIISQYYKGDGNNKWIEVTNISGEIIPENTYFVSLYQTDKIPNPQNTKPSYSKEIPKLEPGETIKFRPSLNVTLPEYALDGTSIKSNVCFFDADDILILTTSKDENSWRNKKDMIWHGGDHKSLIRKYGCDYKGASSGFAIDDWVVYETGEIDSATADTNIRIGIHHSGNTTFRNGNWDNGIPDKNTIAVIEDLYQTSGQGSFSTCKLNITSTGKLNIDPGDYISIKKELLVEGILEVFHEGSLLTTENDAQITNSGMINIHKTTTELKKYDYTYWSSPVKDALLEEVFYASPLNSFFTFNTTEFNDNNQDELDDNAPAAWQPVTGNMTPGKGYTAMAPDTDPFITTQSIIFSGTPNSGTIEVPVELSEKDTVKSNNWNLIGNPYPSAIDADLFLNDTVNKEILGGCIYLWTHATSMESGKYTSDDYAVYNSGTGGISASTSNREPGKYIASCQGFFVQSLQRGNIRFTNSMRTNSGNNNFFKEQKNKTDSKKDRIWLNLYNDEGAFSQILIGFIDGASTKIERNYDAIRFDGNKYLSFYTITENHKLAITGTSPFTGEEIIPLGISSKFKEETTLKIDIEKLSGILKSKDIYLTDKLLHQTHLLNESAYEFKVNGSGIFNNRFELSFKKPGDNYNELYSGRMILLKNFYDHYEVETHGRNPIRSLKVYDMQGRTIFNRKSMRMKDRISKEIFKSNGVFLLVIKIENDRFYTRKLLLYD